MGIGHAAVDPISLHVTHGAGADQRVLLGAGRGGHIGIVKIFCGTPQNAHHIAHFGFHDIPALLQDGLGLFFGHGRLLRGRFGLGRYFGLGRRGGRLRGGIYCLLCTTTEQKRQKKDDTNDFFHNNPLPFSFFITLSQIFAKIKRCIDNAKNRRVFDTPVLFYLVKSNCRATNVSPVAT